MADFLSQGNFLPFKSPVAPIDLNVWANIAQLAMQQQEMSEAMVDKATEHLFNTNAKLSQDIQYKADKQKQLDADIEKFRGTNGFFSPEARSKIRQIVRSNIFDPELQAISNRTAQIAETQKQIKDQQLPAANYMEYMDSFLKAEEEFAATGKYNPNVKLDFNLTPYANLNETFQKAIKEVPEVKNSQFVQNGHYIYVQTETGKDPQTVMNALRGTLGVKEYQQLRQQYKYTLAKSPESLVVQEDVKDAKGTVIYKAGETLTEEEYIDQTLLRVASGATGNSVEITNLQKNAEWDLYLEEIKQKNRIELEKIKNKKKNGGTSPETMAAKANAVTFSGSPVVPLTHDQYQQSVVELSNQRENLTTMEAQKAVAEQNGDDVSAKRLSESITILRAQIDANDKAVSKKAEVYTSVIPEKERKKLVYGHSAFGPKQGNDVPGIMPGKTIPYSVAYENLVASLRADVESGDLTKDQANEIINKFPKIDNTLSEEENASRVLAQALQIPDVFKLESDIQNTEAYKKWDSNHLFAGTIAGKVIGDPVSNAIRSLYATQEAVRNDYKVQISAADNVENDVAVVSAIQGGKYTDDKGVTKESPIMVLNENFTEHVKNNPAGYVDVETGVPISTILKNYNSDFSKTNISTTDGVVRGRHVLAMTFYAKKKDQTVYEVTRHIYNANQEDANNTGVQTVNSLRESGRDREADLLEANLTYGAKIQSAEPEALPSVGSLKEAKEKKNYVDIVMGLSSSGEAVKLRVYKVNKSDYRVTQVVGDTEDASSISQPYSNIRSISVGLMNKKKVNDNSITEEAAVNITNTSNAISTVFKDMAPKKQDMLSNLIGFETANTYSTKSKNNNGGATGLIQFYPMKGQPDKFQLFNSKGEKIILKRDELESMNHVDQMKLVEYFYKGNGLDINAFNSTAEMWLGVFLPSIAKAYQKDPKTGSMQIQELITTYGNGLSWQKVADDNASTIKDAIYQNVSLDVFLRIMNATHFNN